MKIRFSRPRFTATKRGFAALGLRVHFPEVIALPDQAFKSITINVWLLCWELLVTVDYSRQVRENYF
jgi:hypothetical protein